MKILYHRLMIMNFISKNKKHYFWENLINKILYLFLF